MQPTPRFLPAGDCAVVVEYGDRIDEVINSHVHRLARALDRRAFAGVVEIVPTYRSCVVHFNPLVVASDEIVAAIEAVERVFRSGAHDVAAGGDNQARVVEIPVVYGGDFGPDLADVAAHCGLAEDDVVAIHAAGSYRVFMMGFTPGFPYLGGMSPRIAAPRLASPRTRVPAGSVGIAAQQTGIYPTASPGGWRLIGRTPVRLFDPTLEKPSLVGAGDVIRFVPVPAGQFEVLERAEGRAPAPTKAAAPGSSAGIDVIDGGMLTTVQDTGRVGFQRFGVPVAGAMDTFALRAANRLVGNADDAAGLEMTLVGPALRFDLDGVMALTGADMGPCLNGRSVRTWRSVQVRRGDLLTCAGPCRGVRAYLAVCGGIEVARVLRSRATYLASAFGGFEGRVIRTGDRLPVSPADGVSRRHRRAAPGPAVDWPIHDHVVRVMLGPQDDAFTKCGRDTFLSAAYTIGARSDRVGCRLEGPRIEHRAGADIVSDGTSFGSVQVSGDGMPIVLMADRGTTGGYTKIATVVSADLRLLAQATAGDRIRFRVVERAEAIAALHQQESWLAAIADASVARQACDEGIFDEDSGAEWAADGADALAAAICADAVERDSRVAGVRSGMAGLVVAVCVEPGALVAARDTLVVIEAMKMQNPVRAARAGRVARVHVAPGTEVAATTVLVEFED